MRSYLLIAAIVIAALFSAACVDGSGMGVGVGAPARWGGGGGTPPVFVGGPV